MIRMSLTITVTLAGGVELPRVGLGTWQLSGRKGYDAIRYALQAGYRHIDTATVYGNEAEVGRALRDSGLPREGRVHHDEAAARACRPGSGDPTGKPARARCHGGRSLADPLAAEGEGCCVHMGGNARGAGRRAGPCRRCE
jgi:hypothetical protein